MPKRVAYTDLAIKRQVMLERIKSGQVRDFAKVIKDIEKLIHSTILALDEDIGTLSQTRLNKLLSKLRADQAAVFKTGTTTLTANLADISALYMAQEVSDLKRTIDLRGTELNSFTKKDVFSKVIKRPLTTDGQLLEPWIKDFSNREITRVNNVVRAGHSQGKTNQQLVQQIIGTKSQRYMDGVLQTTRRNASTVVRTSVQHAASAARQEIWEANQDVVDKYEFLATLDRITSNQCRALDGQAFEFGQGPIPPIHPNCRSTTIPVLAEEYSFLSEGRTRSGEGGPVPADQSYYDWLKDQPESVQTQVLGPARAKLFRNGGMTAEKFRKLQFDKNFEPLTFDEMRAIEPEAFEKAGIVGNRTTPTRKSGFVSTVDGRPVYRESGVLFTPEQGAVGNTVDMRVNVAKLDKNWKRDKNFYIGKNDQGIRSAGLDSAGEVVLGESGRAVKKSRKEWFKDWRQQNPDTPVETPWVNVSDSGVVEFVNGRHRTSVFTHDEKLETMVVSVDEKAVKNAKEFLGGSVLKPE